MKKITLIAVTSANVALTIRAMDICASRFDFADAVLVTHEDVVCNFRTVKSPKFATRIENGDYQFLELPNIVKTDYALSIQYDGYIADPAAWDDAFLEYDYIGARWPWHEEVANVGNGGFCLQSIRLLEARAKLPPPHEKPDDDYVCRELRPELERVGIRFAPASVADKFSYERHIPDQSTFGFHGIFNMWRHMEDAEMLKFLPQLDEYVIKSSHFDELAEKYIRLNKPHIVEKMIELRKGCNV